MNALKIFLILFFLFLVQSCNDEDFQPKLGNNYMISHVDSRGRFIQEIKNGNGIVIDIDIIAWNFDSVFIIAKQKPYRSIMENIRKENPKISYEKEKRLYKRSEIFNYWIIDQREEIDSYYDEETKRRIFKSAVAGPLTYEEYWDKRRELGVSDTLRLKEPDYSDFVPIAIFQYLFLPRRMRELEHQ